MLTTELLIDNISFCRKVFREVKALKCDNMHLTRIISCIISRRT